ncbi:MAG: lysine--tRNA ligase, partial [Spirochaetales bacterium]|nr:lysine--tRNA ligase [Spirochaetales bacterium]
NPEYIYQAQRYRNSGYAEGIRKALENREAIRAVLNEHRTQPLPEDWWPVSVFSTFTDKDKTKVTAWDGEWGITYRCLETEKEETLDLRKTAAVKLPWRIDWPMRWSVEGVDFEPAGKDHHSEGGSFDTSKKIVEIFGGTPPVSFQYDFIRIKGRGGKISSSSGEVVSLRDVLEIYQPEIIRYLFAGTRPNSEFAISFDLDVLKIYEDYDKCERIYYGTQEVGDKKREKESRIYELSQIDGAPEKPPYQVSLRHLCNILQVNSGDIDAVMNSFEDVREDQRGRLRRRCECAWNWVKTYAPEDFRFSLNTGDAEAIELEPSLQKAIQKLHGVVDRLDKLSEKELAEEIYTAAHDSEVEPRELFEAAYRVLIGKEKGPRLAGFIKTCGREKVLKILKNYL